MNKFLKFTFLSSSAIALIVLVVRNITWRQQYIYEIIDNVRNRLSGAEKEFFKRYTRRETRVNLHTAFAHMYHNYNSNLIQLKHDLSQATLLLDSCIKDDPKGKKAYSECMTFYKELILDIEERIPDPSITPKVLQTPTRSRELDLKWDDEVVRTVTRRLYPSLTYEEMKELTR